MKLFNKILILLVFMSVSACGSSGGGGSNGDEGGANLDFSSLGTQRNLSFNFQVQLADPVTKEQFNYDLPDLLVVPMYVQATGLVKMAAQDFPRIVVRICSADLADDECDTVVSDLEDLKVDLVIDSCGNNVANNKCGEKDETVYTGTMSQAGDLTINAVAMRMRIFLITEDGDGPTGITADDDDAGFVSGLDRLIAKITTGTVSASPFVGTGERIENKEVKMVSAGVIPDSFPEMAGFTYLATMTGSFDEDPLALLP